MLADSVSYRDLIPNLDLADLFDLLKKLHAATLDAVSSNLPVNAVLSYSGGIDSCILDALVTEAGGRQIQSLTLGVLGSTDARKFRASGARSAESKSVECTVSRNEVEEASKEVSKLVRVKNLSHFEDCVCFWLVGKKAQSSTKAETVLSANGPDELYCGYDRFRRILDSEGYLAAEKEIIHALDMADSLRHEVKLVLSKLGLDSCEPLLDQGFRSFSMSEVAVELKILKGDDRLRKRAWRALGRKLGIAEQRVLQPKKAMQYSMGIHQIMLSLLKSKTIAIDFESEASKERST